MQQLSLVKVFLAVGVLIALIMAVQLKLIPIQNQLTKSNLSKTHLPIPITDFTSQEMKGIVTNQWYSSLFFSEWSEPLFIYPLSLKLSPSALELNYPQVVGTPKTVFASHRKQLALSPSLGEFTHKEVLRSDTASVTVRICSGKKCFVTTVTRGIPSLVIEAESDLNLTLSGENTTIVSADAGVELTTDHGKYLVASFDPTSTAVSTLDSKVLLNLKKSEKALIALQPDEKSLPLSEWLFQVNSVKYGIAVSETMIAAGLTYETKTDQLPLIAALPHFDLVDETAVLGTYQSLRGTMKLTKGARLQQNLDHPTLTTVPQMIVKLTPDQRQILTEKVKQELTLLPQQEIGRGVYFGGKDIFKRAQLYEIAQELALSTELKPLESQLVAALDDRLQVATFSGQNTYLSVQNSPKGVLAAVPEFGHELFNDHHFHFSYYLASAGIFATYRPEALANWQTGVEALIADIATTEPKNDFPWIRGFDPYEGHSWADGRALAADGNNQESTSEAVNRWYALVRIAQVLKNDQLIDQAWAGMAQEQRSARTYWLAQEPSRYRFPTGYQSPIASLVWGGKVDYATWFSPSPSHIFGIQFLPSTPAMGYVQNRDAWDGYNGAYSPVTSDQPGWNDIWAMAAVVNGAAVPDSQGVYDGGNTVSWYYLWTTYWSNSVAK